MVKSWTILGADRMDESLKAQLQAIDPCPAPARLSGTSPLTKYRHEGGGDISLDSTSRDGPAIALFVLHEDSCCRREEDGHELAAHGNREPVRHVSRARYRLVSMPSQRRTEQDDAH
jgi:hypothetical protein